jgi:hypothetical protein
MMALLSSVCKSLSIRELSSMRLMASPDLDHPWLLLLKGYSKGPVGNGIMVQDITDLRFI